MATQDSIGKDSIGKDSIEIGERKTSKRFVPPTIDEVEAYCAERKNGIDAEAFIDYYSSQKWKKANGRPVEDWKACVRLWERNGYFNSKNSKSKEIAPVVLSDGETDRILRLTREMEDA